MAADTWNLDASHGQLLVTTGVEGPAAKMGHRLRLAFPWRATVRFADDAPVSVELIADVADLEVLGGEGGVKGLSGPERAIAASNATKTLDAKKHPHIMFRADEIAGTAEGYRLTGTLHIHGTERPQVVDLTAEGLGTAWRLSCEAVVRHSDFGVKPYSMMLGALKVADEVEVSFSAERSMS